MTGLRDLFAGAPEPDDLPERPPETCRVVRSDATGVWVAPIDTDTRTPVGPVRGAVRRTAAGTLQRLPAGTVALLIWTATDPWVVAWEEDI